ncbi:MAG: NYN domain-containing protein [Acidimicrobiales bacterium]
MADTPPTHLVIDGSNIATEGRSLPSLQQLDEAVQAFVKERPHDTFTVVVDATFGHRIDASEKQKYEEALAANEMVTPPAGTIGRGDKFLLEIADRANATVFSNDSFQEFHGEYEWLFDEGRLIGGKPVPQVGWIFTERTPVRGPRSRMASRGASERRGRAVSPSSERRSRRPISPPGPPPVPTSPPPRRRSRARATAAPVASPEMEAPETAATKPPSEPARRGRLSAPEPVNQPLPFIEFIAENGPGSVVEGEVVTFTSHGAFVEIGDVRCYLALKYMGDPAPRSARDVLERGETRSFVVQALDAPRRGIDLALPGFEDIGASAQVEPASAPEAELPTPAPRPPRTQRGRRQIVATPESGDEADPRAPAARSTRVRRATPRTAAAGDPTTGEPATTSASELAEPEGPGREVSAGEVTVETALASEDPARKAGAKKAAAKKAAAKKAAAKKAAAKKVAGTAAAKKIVAKRVPASAAASKEAPTRKAAATAKKSAAKKAAAKKSAAKKAPAKKAPAKKTAAKKVAAKKAVARKAPARKATAKKAVGTANEAAANDAAAGEAATGPDAG